VKDVSGHHYGSSSFSTEEGAPGTHWIGDWVGCKDVLDMVVKKLPISFPTIKPISPGHVTGIIMTHQ